MSLDEWFSLYEETHGHPVNIAIHKVAVPIIFASTLGILWGLLGKIPTLILGLALLLFYARLSVGYAIVMALFIGGLLASFSQIPDTALWHYCAGIFAIAWVFQFVGHGVEGKRPAFMQDLRFFLIGPLWSLRFFLRHWK